MRSDDIRAGLILGGGGQNPGVWLMMPDSGELCSLLSLAEGQSVSALDVDMDGLRVAAGTRDGWLISISCAETPDGSVLPTRHELYCGAAMVCVCLIEGGRLAASDASGRCFVWQVARGQAGVTRLPVGGGFICSLLRLPGGRLAGLSSTGRFHVWDTTSLRLLRTADCPEPSSPMALAPLRSWPARGVLLYSARGGQLAALSGNRLDVVPAHPGELFAAIVDDDRVYTIGREDSVVKTWRDLTAPVAQGCAPPGIVAGEPLHDDSHRLILLDEWGSVLTCRLEGDGVQVVRRLDGSDCRALAGPSPEASQRLREERKATAAQQLAEEVENAPAGDDASVDERLEQLRGLGFTEMSLGLRARRAAAGQDAIGELAARKKLVELLAPGDTRGAESLRSYAQILTSTWQLTEARAAYEHAARLDGGDGGPSWLQEAAEIARRDDCVFQPGLPLRALVEAANLVGTPFTGRWLVERFKPRSSTAPGLTAEALARKYEALRPTGTAQVLPRATTQTPWLLSQEGAERVSLVTIGDGPVNGELREQLAIMLRPDAHRVMLVPCVLLTVPPPQSGCPAAEHNSRILTYCDREQGQVLKAQEFGPVVQAVWTAVRKAHTQPSANR